MTISDKTAKVELVSCEICLKEVPVNEATHPEADDYVVNFCGLECYEQWKSQDKNPDDKGKKSGS